MKRSIYLKTSKPHLRRSAGRAKQSGPYRVVKSRRGTPDCEPRVPPPFWIFRLTRRLAVAQRRVSPYRITPCNNAILHLYISLC